MSAGYPETPQRIREALETALQAAEVEVIDESHLHRGHAGAKGGGGHYRLLVVSAAFEGLSLVKRHRLVYDAMGAMMGREIHALSMRTLTPAER
jgi:BolA protein